jgi:hypothetical protein
MDTGIIYSSKATYPSKTADRTLHQYIPETRNHFEILSNPSAGLDNYKIENKTVKQAGEHSNPRQRNFVQKENDKLRGQQVRKKDLPNKIPTLVNGSTSARVNTTRTCHNLKSNAQKT